MNTLWKIQNVMYKYKILLDQKFFDSFIPYFFPGSSSYFSINKWNKNKNVPFITKLISVILPFTYEKPRIYCETPNPDSKHKSSME